MQAPKVRSAPIPMPRGVHSYNDGDRRAFYAITSRGELLNGEVRYVLGDETAATVEHEMWRDLKRHDPVSGPPRLSLYVAGALRR